jgi:hypothetical protein
VSPSPNNPVWKLEEFDERLDIWLAGDGHAADPETRILVLAWIQSRMDDPYAGVRRDGRIDNLWYGKVPDTQRDDGQVVVGMYFIFEAKKIVKCDSFSFLSPPIYRETLGEE